MVVKMFWGVIWLFGGLSIVLDTGGGARTGIPDDRLYIPTMSDLSDIPFFQQPRIRFAKMVDTYIPAAWLQD